MEKITKIKTIELLKIIALYYIAKDYNLFPYAISLSLYYIFTACFSNLNLPHIKEEQNKKSTIKLLILSTLVISLIFLILSLLLSDIMNTLINTEDMFLIFLFMGLSIVATPLINIYSEYLTIIKHKAAKIFASTYYLIEFILYIFIIILFFKILKFPNNIAISFLYLPKIITIILMSILCFLILKKKSFLEKNSPTSNNYQVVKKILTKNFQKSFIKIITNTYLYISIITVYLVLTTRYNYNEIQISTLIPTVYLYLNSIINYYLTLTTSINNPSKDILYNLYYTFKIMLPLAIIGSIISPMICQIIFNNANISIYLSPLLFLALFQKMFDISSQKITNKKYLNISLIVGLITKIIITIPLINAIYRMGYNLIYGDILSTILSFIISTIINYLYIKNKYQLKERYLGKILTIVYENILLSITLIITEFIFPLNNMNYLKALIYLPIYLTVSILFIKIKNKKRG